MTTLPRPLLLALAGAACTAPAGDPLADLAVGAFVDAKGDWTTGAPLVREIDPAVRTADDKPDKVEVTAPVEGADGTSVRLVGTTFTIDADTGFEDADKRTLPPFTPAAGDWLRVKARDQGDAGLRARTLRAIPPRDQFKVTGEVRAVDRERRRLDVGGVPLTVAPDVDLEVGGRRDPDDPLALFLADDQKAVPFSLRLSDSLRLGGQAAAESEWEDEFDLDAGRDRDRTKPSFGGKLDALWLLDDRGSYALGEVAFGRSDVLREGGVDSHEDKLELTRAFASLAVAADLQLLVGRQDFDEGREWLYDEVLDGVRAVLRRGPLELEAGVAAGREVAAEDNAYEDTGVWLANARWHLDPVSWLGAYVLQRTDDSGAGFEPLLFGVRSHREVRQGLGHWLELGFARGRAGGRDVDGYAFDAGCLFTFDTAWRPALAAGLAHGSGRADGDTASGYRQSGLQDNNAKVGGVTSVRYYGELLDPELANLTVATAAVAVRPFAGASLSLLWHGYRQDVAATGSPDSSLRTTPTGTSRDLGQELDLVFGYRAARRFTLELVYARFEPGSAFAADTGADLIAFTTRLSF